MADFANTGGHRSTNTDRYTKKIIEASKAVERVVRSTDSLSEDERKLFDEDIKELKNMLQKLDDCHIEIAVFGEVSSGKSALLNALLGRSVFPVGAAHGITRDLQKEEWDTVAHESSVLANSTIRLVDTPGLNEVDGSQRAEMAKQMSRRSDIILFVVDSDLNQVEHAALAELGEASKPIILVLNKTDILSEQQIKEIRESILKDKLPPQVTEDDLIYAAADPKKKEVIVVEGDEERLELRRPAPDVENVILRILEYLKKDGKGLVALNAALFASDVSEKIVNAKIALRKEQADGVIWNFALIKASAVALNPIPAVDLLGAGIADITMIIHLGNIYGFEVGKFTALGLWKTVLVSNIALFGAEWVSHVWIASGKAGTGGASTLLTATPQAAAAALGSYVIGYSVREYFANDQSWGVGGAKAVVNDIIEHCNTDLIKERLADLIERKLKQKKSRPFSLESIRSFIGREGSIDEIRK